MSAAAARQVLIPGVQPAAWHSGRAAAAVTGKRDRHFQVNGNFDGRASATVSITADGRFLVRPKWSRRTYEAKVHEIAELLVRDVLRVEAIRSRLTRAQKRKQVTHK